MEPVHARTNRLIAVGVFLIAFFAFITSVAPTVSFWDCGEYISAGHKLGIPHPPGNPLFVLLMRVASMGFSFFEDVGYRMNFSIVVMSALTAMFIYLAAVRVIVSFTGIPDNLHKRITVYVGGITAGLFAVFGYTFWFSAVETSTYNTSMLAIAICTWLILKWYQSTNVYRDRLLVLITFIAFLGIGLHMYTMIILPPVFLFVIMVDKEKRGDWRFWATAFAMGSILYTLSGFIWIGPVTAAALFVIAFSSKNNTYKWRLCFWLAFFALLGFSVHTFIPIRSTLEPMINMNQPDNWESLINVLERRQYGSESMISRMFWRRGALANQFGIEGHMGWGGFHLTQFFRLGAHDTERSFFIDGLLSGTFKLLIYLIPTALMFFGWAYLFKRNRPVAILLITLAVLTSVGLVLYINFSDGTRPDSRDVYQHWVQMGRQGPAPTVHREVRIRDYFFTAGFMFYGMWIGLAIAALLHKLFGSKDNFLRSTVAPALAILLVASPAVPLVTNHQLNNRSQDWIAYDYAYNLLMSCKENGVLFTNGDNDTFPLWALQEAYGIRTDVRVVNLSLLNTDWYIKQLQKLEPTVPIRLSEDAINRLRPERNFITTPTAYNMKRAGISVQLPTVEQHNVMRVQDWMLLHIIDANAWEKPIYIAITVSDNNLMGLGPHLKSQGLVNRIMPYRVPQKEQFDMERTIDLLDNVYQFRGLGEDAERLNSTSRNLLSNYSAVFIQTALHIREMLPNMQNQIEQLKTQVAVADGRDTHNQQLSNLEVQYKETIETAIDLMSRCSEMIPWDWRPRALRHEFYMLSNRYELAVEKMKEALQRDPDNANYLQMLSHAEDNLRRSEKTDVTADTIISDFSEDELIPETEPALQSELQ